MKRFEFIQDNRTTFSIRAMTRVLKVTRSGFYQWFNHQDKISARQQTRNHFDANVKRHFENSKGRSGGERILHDLAGSPNQKWCGDITFLYTSEGWLYLVVVIDLYSRAVMGWSISE